jgi:uncharacterized membrane protein YccC
MRRIGGFVAGAALGSALPPYVLISLLISLLLCWILIVVVALAAVFCAPARRRAAYAVLKLLLASHKQAEETVSAPSVMNPHTNDDRSPVGR